VKSATDEHTAAVEYQHVLFEQTVHLLGPPPQERASLTVKQPAAWPLTMGVMLSRNVCSELPF